MPVDWSAWRQQVDAEAAKQPVRAPLIHPTFAQHIRAVAARLEHLPDSDAWAVYRAEIETLIAEVETHIAALREQMDDMVGDEHARARLRLERMLGRCDGYREALQVPGVVLGTDRKLAAETPPEPESA